MSIFIKAGLWAEKKLGHKGEFDLTRFVNNLIDINLPVPEVKPYKLYEANLTQSGTAIPSSVEMQNEIGVLTLSRVSSGVYKITGTGLFVSGKTTVMINQTNPLYNITAQILNTNEIQINARSLSVGLDADNVLLNTTIEIKVYN